MRTAALLLLGLGLAAPAAAQSLAEPTLTRIYEASVLVATTSEEGSEGTGSGVLVRRGDQHFVWTCAHVVAPARRTRELVELGTGRKRTAVTFTGVRVSTPVIQHFRVVGRYELDAEVLGYSRIDGGEDLALLRLHARGFRLGSLQGVGTDPPPIGRRLYHVGNPAGAAMLSVSDGLMSQQGRVFHDQIYDQTTVPHDRGSSGGGLFTEDGTYVGMVARTTSPGFNMIIPARRIRAWAARHDILGALDRTVAAPSEATLRALPRD